MIGMPFHTLQEKGVLEFSDFRSIDKWNKAEKVFSNSGSGSGSGLSNSEPTSVLDTRRSPSPPTSTSTLASSFGGTTGVGGGGGGGGGSTDNSSATAVSDNTTFQKWPISEIHPANLTANEPAPKDEWPAELQPIPNGLEIVTGGVDRCVGVGLGLEDWESMLSDSGGTSPGQEQSLLGWIAGDVDEASFGLKQLLQGGGNPLEFDCNAELGIVDQGTITTGLETAVGRTTINPSMGFPRSGFSPNNNSSREKVGPPSGLVNQNPNMYSSQANNNLVPLPVSLPPGMMFQQQQQFETPDEKPQIFNPQQQLLINQQSLNPNFFPVFPYPQQDPHHPLQPQPKRHNSGGINQNHQSPKAPFADLGHELLLRKQQQQQQQQQQHPPGFHNQLQLLPSHHPHNVEQKSTLMVPKQKVMGPGEELAQHHHYQQQQQHYQQQQQHYQQQQQQQQLLLDQLIKAAELVGTGNFSHAQGILARLNHQLSSPSGKPFQRATFYFKEALQLILMNNPVTYPPLRSPTPFDVIFKMGAYKLFSEVSPLIQFANFTCNQALLEALDDADRIHIVDFDIGFGAQWASFMQELPVRNRGAPSLKITAFASPSTHHPLELALLRENLTLFADEIGIAFQLEVVNLDSFDLNSYAMPIFRSESEAIAVNFPIWSCSNHPAVLPSLLRFVKQLSPKIVVSLDRGCDRSDLPFPQHILHAIHSYINLLESLDAVNVTPDAVNKIEKFLLQPKIESTVLGGLRVPDKMPLWKTIFASAGFSPVIFSNFTETQAECVVKKTPVRGFHVEKRQASLVLCWQRRELISASAWRC